MTVPSRPGSRRPLPSALLAWLFVAIWGSGYIASKAGLQFVPPFTFLLLRYTCAFLLLLPFLALWHRREPLRWPRGRRELAHVVVAGLLMHVGNLGGSHYSQYLGMSAGVTALVLALQPLATAAIAAVFMHERLRGGQWLGVFVGLAGVALVVWHKLDVRAISGGALGAVLFSLVSITIGTLYQRVFCPTVDLRTASLVQFAASVVTLVPLALTVEHTLPRWSWTLVIALAYLVILGSIFAFNALNALMRRGEATRVTSLLYLTPIFAVVLEWLLFGVVPTGLTIVGIAVTCVGVALVAWRSRPQEAAVA